MRWWPFRRHHNTDREEPAVQALAESERKLQQAKDQTPRIDRAVSRAEQLRRRNNFAPLFDAALREHRP